MEEEVAAEKDKIEEEMDRQISQRTDRLTNNMGWRRKRNGKEEKAGKKEENE